MDTLVQLGDFFLGFGVFMGSLAALWFVSLYAKKS